MPHIRNLEFTNRPPVEQCLVILQCFENSSKKGFGGFGPLLSLCISLPLFNRSESGSKRRQADEKYRPGRRLKSGKTRHLPVGFGDRIACLTWATRAAKRGS